MSDPVKLGRRVMVSAEYPFTLHPGRARLKRSDIDDTHVVALAAERWGTDPDNWVPDVTRRGVVRALTDEGIPLKLARAKVEHLVSRRLLDYGVSVDFAWPTPAGLALLREAKQQP